MAYHEIFNGCYNAGHHKHPRNHVFLKTYVCMRCLRRIFANMYILLDIVTEISKNYTV